MMSGTPSGRAKPHRRSPDCRYHGAPPTRRRDIVLAVIFAASVHGLLFFGDVFGDPKTAPRRVSAAREEVIQFAMPVPDEEPTPEPQEAFGDEFAPPSLAPPMLADVPTVNVSLFTQPLQIAPQNVQIGQGAVRVPVGRPGSPLGKGLGSVFDITKIDQAPTVRSHVPPDYPLELRRRGVTGSVVVEFVVDQEGNVVVANATESTNPAFDAAAVNAVSRWKFRPGKKNGRAVSTRVRQVVTFNLEKD